MVSLPLWPRAARPFALGRFAPAIPGFLLLCGCASGVYPSLERRPGEGATPSVAAAAPALPAANAPVISPALLDGLRQKAGAAHAQFAALVAPGESAAGAARGATADSDAAARANLALARLHAARNLVSGVLADLDRLSGDDRMAHALVDGPASPPRPQRSAIAAAQADVLALLQQEDAVLARLER